MMACEKSFGQEITEKWRIKTFDIEEEPFRIYGIYKPEGEDEFIRIPREVAEKLDSGVREVHNAQTSGGRIRFKTDSACIALKCCYPYVRLMPHMPLTGSIGFDIYADGEYISNFHSNFYPAAFFAGKGMEALRQPVVFENVVEFQKRKMRDIVIYFPLYNAVNKVFVGVEETAHVEKGEEYTGKLPFVAYGSSITQGACASRPGNLYTNIISRKLNADFISLGFNGSAKAEEAIAEYIAGIQMSAFIYDYDHNAPDAAYLKNTHYKMYKLIRDAHPCMPIVMLSRANFSDDYKERLKVIEDTYHRACREGDRHICFVSGQDIAHRHDHNMMTVDGVHPNDFGMFCIAEAVQNALSSLW